MKDISYIFSECNSLQSLSDISKWDITNVIDIYDMFSGYNPSLNIPSKYKECIIY